MENSYPWAKALNVSEIDLERWQEEAPPKAHLLNWCLDHEKINPQEYYEWAKDYYQLAMLNESFFNHAPNIELWNQIQSVSNWSPNMVPVRQWDGVVFIACVEPQTEIPWSFPVQFLLAPRRELLNYWMNLHNQAQSAVQQSPKAEDPQQKPEPELAAKTQEPVTPQAVVTPPPQPSEASQPEQNFTLNTKPENNQPSTEAEVPEGFPVFDTPDDQSPAGLDLSQDSADSAPVSDAPAGFDFDMTNDSSSKEEDLFSGFDQAPAQAPESPSMDNLNVSVDNVPENPLEGFNSEPEPQPSSTAAASPEPEPPAQTVNEAQQPITDNEPVPETSEEPVANDLDEATAILNTTNVTQKQNPLIGELKTRYQNVVILSAENQKLIPYDWDSGLTVKREAIDIEQPSFLKVVNKSKKPYHGYLAENQFHKNLFNSWGMESLPPHVTAVPVMEGATLKFVVIGIGDEGCAGYQMIHFVESSIKEYPLISSPSSQAA